jgi:O-antigen/teichoic acid export membrane protein
MSETSQDSVARIAHREDLSTMARGTGVALGGGLLGSGLAWASQLLLARLLGPGGFGSYSICLAIVSITAQISTVGLASATIYFVARYARDEAAKARDVLIQSVAASLLIGMVSGAILFLFAPLIARHFFHRPEVAPVLRVFALAIGLVASYKVAKAATTVSYRIGYRVLLDLLSGGSFVLFFIVLYLLGGRLGGAAVAFFLSYMLGFSAAVYLLFQIYPNLFAAPARSSLVLKEVFTYSMPAFAANLFGAPRNWMDRLLIGYFRAPAEVGLYQAAAQSVTPLYVAAIAVSSIAGPMIATLFNRGERARLEDAFRVSTRWILYSALVVFIVIVAGPRDVLKVFFGPRYQNGVVPLVLLSIASVIENAAGTAGSMLMLTGHQKTLLRISAICLILQFGLDLYLVPHYGIVGASIAEVAVSFSVATSKLIAVKRVIGLSPYDRRYWKGLLAMVITAAGLYLIRPHGFSILTITVMLRAALALAIFAAVMIAAGLDAEDRQVLAAAFAGFSKRYFGRTDEK